MKKTRGKRKADFNDDDEGCLRRKRELLLHPFQVLSLLRSLVMRIWNSHQTSSLLPSSRETGIRRDERERERSKSREKEETGEKKALSSGDFLVCISCHASDPDANRL